MLTQILTTVLIPVAAMVLGGILAALRRSSMRLRNIIQHIAAGLVFAVIAIELLPDILHKDEFAPVILGFGFGICMMMGAKQLMRDIELEGEAARQRFALVVPVGVNVLISGLLIGIGFAIGMREGGLLTLALSIEALFLGLTAAATLIRAGTTQAWAVAITVTLGVLLAGSAVVAWTLFGGGSGHVLTEVLAFGIATLLYFVIEELLVEAYEVPETPLATGAFFLGFLILIVIEMAV